MYSMILLGQQFLNVFCQKNLLPDVLKNKLHRHLSQMAYVMQVWKRRMEQGSLRSQKWPMCFNSLTCTSRPASSVTVLRFSRAHLPFTSGAKQTLPTPHPYSMWNILGSESGTKLVSQLKVEYTRSLNLFQEDRKALTGLLFMYITSYAKRL